MNTIHPQPVSPCSRRLPLHTKPHTDVIHEWFKHATIRWYSGISTVFFYCPRITITTVLSSSSRLSSTKSTRSLGSTAHGLHPLSDGLVNLEELGSAAVDTDCLALEQVGLIVSVALGVGLDAL